MEKFLEKIVVSTITYVREDPKKLFVLICTPILILSAINFIDFFMLPTTFISDEIISRTKLTRKHTVLGYQYGTEKGFNFTTSKAFIKENDIDLEHTKIFGTVTFVDSDRRDYTEKLTSNLNGILKYFHFIFFVSLSYGIVTFLYDKTISNDKYLNIVIFNSIMFGILLYMLIFN